MPKFQYIDHRIEIESHNQDYTNVKVYEIAEAHEHPLAK